jgi:Protein of unknown function (DUF2599)
MPSIKHFFVLILLFSFSISLIPNVNVNAQFEIQSEQLNQSQSSTQEIINNADPQKPKLNKFKRKNNKLTSDENGLKKEFQSKEKKVKLSKTIDNKTHNLEIGTPESVSSSSSIVNIQADKLLLTSDNNKVDVNIENVDGGVRQVIVIKDNNQPNRFQFPMKTPEGFTFKKNPDESVNLTDESGKTILTILKPWARDKNGKELQTYYEVEDKLIVQFINYEGAEFPVTADPTWCGNSYYKLEWEDRASEGGLTLKISPTWCGRQIGVNYWEAWESFKDVAWNAPWRPEFDWYNKASQNNTNTYWSLFKQYHCHTITASWKETWNLEPKRPNYNWRTFMNPRWIDGKPIPCNPE